MLLIDRVADYLFRRVRSRALTRAAMAVGASLWALVLCRCAAAHQSGHSGAVL